MTDTPKQAAPAQEETMPQAAEPARQQSPSRRAVSSRCRVSISGASAAPRSRHRGSCAGVAGYDKADSNFFLGLLRGVL